MEFKQYTRCVEPSKFRPRSLAKMALIAAAIAAPFIAAALLAGHPFCLVLAAEIGSLTFVILYCRNFLYGRLVCLGGERDAVGAVIQNQPPPPVEFSLEAFDWDTDYSINLLLPCTEFGVSRENANGNPLYGELIRPHPLIENLSLPTVGKIAKDEFGTKLDTCGLHAEFEGAGNYYLMEFAQAMLGIAFVGFLACLTSPIGWIFALLVLLGALLGAIISKFADVGEPTDLHPNEPGSIHVNDEDNGGRGRGADIVYIQGTWVYDPLHDGRNEIHPIKVCTLVGRWEGDWASAGVECNLDETPPIILRLRQGFEEARAGETLANQARPEHQWNFHPDLDGCARTVIL